MNMKFNVSGMSCAACSARVEKVTASVPGVKRADVNLLAGTMTVEATDESCSDLIISAIANAGYGAIRQGSIKREHEERSNEVDQNKNYRFSILFDYLDVLYNGSYGWSSVTGMVCW